MKLLAAVLIALGLSIPAALADKGNHYGWEKGNGNPHGSAPLPIAGAGLPAFAAAGIIYLLRRRKPKD